MQYDLIIVGGGLVGAGFAAALQNTHLKIALIDARLPNNNDSRLFALNHSSCHFLTNLGLWSELVKHASPIHQVHVSHQGQFGAVRLNRDEINLEFLGYVIPAALIEASLNQQLLASSVTFYRPARLKELTQQEGMARLTLDLNGSEKEMFSPIVIGADGTDSTVRTQAKIAIECFEYSQRAIVTRSKLQRSHQHIAYERFTKKGVIAMLPLSEQECATIWTADEVVISELMQMSDTDFVNVLQQEFGYRLGKIKNIQQRFMFPLRKVIASQLHKECVLLIGNAAHTVHPLAAQGFNLALQEVAGLSEFILQSDKLPTARELESVLIKVQKQQGFNLNLSHHLWQLFENHSALLPLALPLGMTALDVLLPLKKRFIQKLAGRHSNMSSLLMSAERL